MTNSALIVERRPPKWYTRGIGTPSAYTRVSCGAEPQTTIWPAPNGARAIPGRFSDRLNRVVLGPGHAPQLDGGQGRLHDLAAQRLGLHHGLKGAGPRGRVVDDLGGRRNQVLCKLGRADARPAQLHCVVAGSQAADPEVAARVGVDLGERVVPERGMVRRAALRAGANGYVDAGERLTGALLQDGAKQVNRGHWLGRPARPR